MPDCEDSVKPACGDGLALAFRAAPRTMTRMQLQVRKNGAVMEVELEGRLDVAGVGRINDQFSFQVIAHDGPVVVDFSKVSFVASLGLGMLVTAAKALRRKGHVLTVFSPQPLVQETLRTAGIHRVVEISHQRPSGGPQE